MNRASFLTLVNLHLDQEIRPKERIAMENALRKHPEYRQLFMQYRYLNVATQLVFKQQKSLLKRAKPPISDKKYLPGTVF